MSGHGGDVPTDQTGNHGNYNRYYSVSDDRLNYTKIDPATVFLPATGHYYINPQWTWRVDNNTGAMTATLNVVCELSQSLTSLEYVYGAGTYYAMGKKESNFGLHAYSGEMMIGRKAFLFLPESTARELVIVFDDGVTENLNNKSTVTVISGTDALHECSRWCL